MPLHPRALPTGFIALCFPRLHQQPPCGEEWLDEIKHDGFRVIAREEGLRVGDGLLVLRHNLSRMFLLYRPAQ